MIKRAAFLFWFNIKSLLTDYKKMFLLFLLPFMILLVVLTVFNKDNRIDSPTEKIGIGIVDLEQTNVSKMLISNITEEDTISNLLKFQMLDLKKAESTLATGEITAFIIIPENFSTGLLNMENPPINIVYDGNNSIEFFIIYKTVESFSKYVNYVEICTASEYYALIDMGFTAEDALKINDTVSFRLIMDTLGRKILFDSRPIYQFPSVSSMIYHGVPIFCADYVLYQHPLRFGYHRGKKVEGPHKNQIFRHWYFLVLPDEGYGLYHPNHCLDVWGNHRLPTTIQSQI